MLAARGVRIQGALLGPAGALPGQSGRSIRTRAGDRQFERGFTKAWLEEGLMEIQ